MELRMTLIARRALGAGSLAAAALLAACGGGKSQTLGYAIVGWNLAVYETPYHDECPEGLAYGNDALWWKSLPVPDRAKLTQDGTLDPVGAPRRMQSAYRGPNGEDGCWMPEAVKDPPLRTVEGSVSYGMDLDGKDDGSATPKSCKHVNFVSPDGAKGVDNQLYRLMGCHYGWRKDGYVDRHANIERRDTSHGVTLIEVTGVDDLKNDPSVEVAFYKKADDDALPKDPRADILGKASYRIHDTPRYGARTKGRIENGWLITEPVDITMPYYGNQVHVPIVMRDMRLKLNVADTDKDSEGMLAGYYDLAAFWRYIQQIEYLNVTGQFSCSGVYTAMKQLADGYPDPKTGECTALSSAFKVMAVPAFVSHVDPQHDLVQADLRTPDTGVKP
jgi:hypothetical protein